LQEPLGAAPGEVPKDACRPARDWLAHRVPSSFNCNAPRIFLLLPPLFHRASPLGHIKGREERHAALASRCRPPESGDGRVNLWTLPFLFPGAAAVHAPSRQRRPKGSPLALGGGQEDAMVGRKPGQPRQGNLAQGAVDWGVPTCGHTVPAATCVRDWTP